MTVRNEGILASLRNIHWNWARNETKISLLSFLLQAKREMEAKGSEEKRQKISVQKMRKPSEADHVTLHFASKRFFYANPAHPPT